jgi:hypothetical protein
MIYFLEYHKGGERQILKRRPSTGLRKIKKTPMAHDYREGEIWLGIVRPSLQEKNYYPPACIRRNLITSPSFNSSLGLRIF